MVVSNLPKVTTAQASQRRNLTRGEGDSFSKEFCADFVGEAGYSLKSKKDHGYQLLGQKQVSVWQRGPHLFFSSN